ncbi:hypothetical protein HYV79_03835 [Candidatus Woesearchaeota archaeon]|nr:hypothetical protein [Candidatus Woesearchaeota archaeon]
MALFYQTLSGKKLYVDQLNGKQRQFLKEVYDLYSQKSYLNFFNAVYSPEFLKKMNAELSDIGYIVDDSLMKTTLYQIVHDLELRLGLKQGFYAEEINTTIGFSNNKKTLKQM